MSTLSTLDAFRASQQAPKGGAESFYLTGEAKSRRLYKPGKAGTAIEQVRIVASAQRIAEGKNPYYEEVFMHLKDVPFGTGGKNREYEIYCPKRNDGKPCPMCAREEQLKKQGFDRRDVVKLQHGDAAMSTDPEAKALLQQANKYQARRFYALNVIVRGRESEGLKQWFIKENLKKEGVWDKLLPAIQSMASEDVDISDPQAGYDLKLTIADKDRINGGGTYRDVVSLSFAAKPSPLSASEVETAKIISDPLVWRQVKKPLSVPGYLTPEQFLEETAAGRMPTWDDSYQSGGKYPGAWIVYPPQGQPFHAIFKNSPQAQAANQHQGTVPSLEATTLGQPTVQAYASVAPQPVLAPQPAPNPVASPVTVAPTASASVATGPTGGVKSYNDFDSLPF